MEQNKLAERSRVMSLGLAGPSGACRSRHRTLLGGAGLAFALLTTPAVAQSPASAGSNGIGEIIVTAQKRETRLQDTPASIGVVDASILQNAAIYGINDLTRVAPGLDVTDAGPGQRRVSLRGIRSSGEAQVAIYYDEAPLTGAPGTTSDSGGNQGDLQAFDVERIEVLRGPQGTLFGSSSMGGTVRIIHQKPGFDYGATINTIGSTTAHAGENYQINAMVNLPVVSDLLAVRGVYFRRKNAGWIDNPSIGQTKVNREETEGGRLLVRLLPVAGVTVDLALHAYDTKAANPIWAPAQGRFVSANRARMDFYDKSQLYSAVVNADLGFADLVVTGSYQDRDSLFIRDPYYLMQVAKNNPAFCRRHFDTATCATPDGMADFNAYVTGIESVQYVSPQTMNNTTAEARLQSKPSELLSWTVGAYWSKRNSWVGSNGILADSMGRLMEDQPLVYTRQVKDHLRQVAGFGEVSVTPLDGLTLTGGLRYYDYDRVVAGDTQKGFDLINFAVQPWTERETRESGWLYKANISYKAAQGILVYAQAASGFRPGGANQVLGLPSSFTPYESDSLWTYEGGLKTTLLDRRLTLNLAAYLTDWTNMQVQGTSGTFAFLTNAGSARIKGLEAEVIVVPVNGLQLTGNLNWLSAKLVEDQINDLVIASGRKGDRVPNIPRISYALGTQYEWDVGSDLSAMVRADLNYVGRSHSDFRPTSSAYLPLGGYTLVGARAGLRTERWEAYLFVSNLFDEIARTSASNMIGSTVETVTTATPRTIGVELKWNF
ncbi:TonB-dependent receptor [Sphingomonas flavalba]|uniref:TonB-dependent receptor n=1 Tax=Sphingomonas flavalba TaxID=2559804 RepID=UPI00109DF641|nr:TonB-dependent receptor [Sphingomonas flavalba]